MLRALTRRDLIKVAGTLAAPVVLAACSGTPTANKPASTQPPAAAAPTKAAPTAQAATAAGTIPLSITVRPETLFSWQKDAAKAYAKANPKLQVQIIEVVYTAMAKKQLAMLATNSLPDVVYSGLSWFDYSAYKGAFKALDDYVKADATDMGDFFSGAVDGCKLDGKLYALPYTINTGNTNIFIYNKDLLSSKGVAAPTDDWTINDFVKAATAITQPDKHVYGTNYITTNYYDFSTNARSFGGDLLSEDGKKFTFATDPKSVQAAQWQVDLRTKVHAATPRADVASDEGVPFAAGQIGFYATGTYTVESVGKTIGNKFKWDVVLGPKGPGGLRGYEMFVSMYSVAHQTKQTDEAVGLLKAETSKATGKLSFSMGLPPARASIWLSPEAKKQNSIYGRAAAWLTDGKDKGPFPMPYNLRFSELQDKWSNVSPALFYGEVSFEKGLQTIQQACAAIVDEPRPS